ncbi:hepatic lectin-like [Patiria miniata]|uniref:C-type lectin domain-containing protein n=1 Tax=Patiria miniata TaxID=46514 RepID=A0A914BLL9_PATMI|nr:hepatic lectin-like [Patiria miniata]
MCCGEVVILISLAILSAILSLSSSCNRRNWLCTAPWKKWGGSCYLSTQRHLTYDDAREACRRQVAAPRSDQENDFLASLAQGSVIWVACTDRRQEGLWECEGFQDGQGIFANWRKGEPNNCGVREDCVYLQLSYKWNDVRCEIEIQAVCKR